MAWEIAAIFKDGACQIEIRIAQLDDAVS